MENPVKLQLAPWAWLANYKGGVKAASVLPNRPACSAPMTGSRRVRHVPMRNLRHPDLPAHRCRCRRLARPATSTCNLVQERHQRVARDESTRPRSLERPADRSRELGVSGILTT
jgi:hypothetical protein